MTSKLISQTFHSTLNYCPWFRPQVVKWYSGLKNLGGLYEKRNVCIILLLTVSWMEQKYAQLLRSLTDPLRMRDSHLYWNVRRKRQFEQYNVPLMVDGGCKKEWKTNGKVIKVVNRCSLQYSDTYRMQKHHLVFHLNCKVLIQIKYDPQI